MTDEALVRALSAIVGARHVVHRPEALTAYECDAYTLQRGRPRVAVLPGSRDEVVAIVKLLYEAGIPFIPRGAGTSLSGGCIPQGGEAILCLTRMNRILAVDLDNERAVVEPGYINAHLTAAVSADGYFYAPDPSSQQACTLGGNVGENSGGPHCLKYGVTTNHVLGLEVVLPDGQLVTVGGAVPDEPGFDLTGLLVGTEGTMGVVTAITVRLLRQPEGVRTVLALFDRMEDASQTVSGVIARGIVPAALEMMDRWAIRAVEMGAYPVGFPDDLAAVLLIEVDGLAAGLDEQVERILAVCREYGVREVRVAQSAEERTLWWNNRKTAFGAMGNLAPDYYVQDGVIPRSRLTEVLQAIEAVAARHELVVANVFHAGDGNLHPLISYDHRRPGEVERVVRAGSEILAACVAAGGSISGEHGIGIEKKDDMRLIFTDTDMAAQVAVRQVFDPLERCNPGKIFPVTGRCVEVKRMPDEARKVVLS